MVCSLQPAQSHLVELYINQVEWRYLIELTIDLWKFEFITFVCSVLFHEVTLDLLHVVLEAS